MRQIRDGQTSRLLLNLAPTLRVGVLGFCLSYETDPSAPHTAEKDSNVQLHV